MNKAFLYVCTLIALFISISGVASVRSALGLVFPILFFPVTGYLLYATISQIRNPRKTAAVSLTAHPVAMVVIFFLLFVVIFAKMISIFMMPV